MKENKNIDRLFQEKLSTLNVEPKNEAWENIELRLKEKKKKRVVPFWWKLSGIAAAFVIGLGVYNFAFNDENVSNDVVIDNGDTVNKKEPLNSISIEKVNGNEVVSGDKNGAEEIKSKDVNTTIKVNTNSANNDAVTDKSNENRNSKNDSNVNNSMKNTDAVANKSNENRKSKTDSNQNNGIKNTHAVANKLNENRNSKTDSNLNNSIKNDDAVANKSESPKTDKSLTDKNIEIPLTNNNNLITKNLNSDLKKDVVQKTDSTSIASVVPNAMEELLLEKEKKTIKKEPKLNRWQLSSNVAPIYFSSASNGSPLDSELKNNSKTYKTNLSYGLGINYAVNKKIKLRTGINSVGLNYDTNDVVIFQNANAKSLQHVKSNAMGSLIQIESRNSSAAPTLEVAPSGNLVTKFNSVINQEIGYLEIPLELSYKIVDKKFGIDVIGGVSTLLLNQNEVSVISSGVEMNIGEADNLSNIHFSTNIGLGFRYGFFKNFEARIEPMFKYQINTFVRDSGDFKPYFLGLYSGITFTF